MIQPTKLKQGPEESDLREELTQVIRDTKPDPFYTRIFDAIIEAVRDDDDQTSSRISMAIEAVEERAQKLGYDWGYEVGYDQAVRDLKTKK